MEDAYKEASDYEKSVKEEDFEFHDFNEWCQQITVADLSKLRHNFDAIIPFIYTNDKII